MQLRLSTLIWIVAVSASCLATWQYNAIYAPIVSTLFAILFIIRESRSPECSTAKLERIGAWSSGIGTFFYMIAVLSLDLATVFSFTSESVDVEMLLRLIFVSLVFAFTYAAIASCLGAIYGLCCAFVLRMAKRYAIRHPAS